MAKELNNQMKGAIGESLVAAHLIAHGWPTVNVNSSIDNFKGVDLFCQHGIDSKEVVGIQVKTTFKGDNDNIAIGMTNGQAAALEHLKQAITGPWVFVHIKKLDPLDAVFYILTAKQMINLVYGLHHWYLYGWERRPCSESLLKGPAGIRIAHIKGKLDTSKYSETCFDNPMNGVQNINDWDNIWT